MIGLADRAVDVAFDRPIDQSLSDHSMLERFDKLAPMRWHFRSLSPHFRSFHFSRAAACGDPVF